MIGDEYGFGKSVTYQCNSGFILRGSNTRTCTSSGVWTGVKPTCQGGRDFSLGLFEIYRLPLLVENSKSHVEVDIFFY